MVQINFAQKEIQCKIVYYGPGMSGKTTNLELVHAKAPDSHRGELTSIATTGERTLYFDYMPLDLGQIAGISTKFQLYTGPGQIYYKSTRRLVLQGVDGIVFVADSSREKLRENKESLADLEDNLKEMGKTVKDVPIVLQYNKRDLPDAMTIEELDLELNPHGFPTTEATATTGEGVFPTLKQLASMVLEAVN
ncbi:MAG: ADP-ribosylation factor-like protein, partial [Planctomycetota bacterium]|nr:ADP-ribosylation factor-like protein [Planctomycetota bacterium]